MEIDKLDIFAKELGFAPDSYYTPQEKMFRSTSVFLPKGMLYKGG